MFTIRFFRVSEKSKTAMLRVEEKGPTFATDTILCQPGSGYVSVDEFTHVNYAGSSHPS